MPKQDPTHLPEPVPEVFWNLPDGWKISEPLFPAPERMVEPGGLIAYGYKKPFMLLFTATPPQESAEKEVKQDMRERFGPGIRGNEHDEHGEDHDGGVPEQVHSCTGAQFRVHQFTF